MAAVVLVAPPSLGPVCAAPRRSRLLAAAATVALLGLLVANRPLIPIHGDAASAERRAEQAGIDVDGIVDRLSHGLTETGAGTFTTGDHDYRATFGPSGFTMAPAGQPGGLEIALRTASAGPWTAAGNVASRSVGPGLTEQVTASQGAVEWDVVVARRPAGGGDLRIEAGLGGLAAARIVDGHWDLTLPGGGRLEMDALVVKDRTGRTLYRALPAIAGHLLTMVVPARVLDAAQYPLVVDPTVSAERAVGTVRAEGNQSAPAVAWNGTVFLAAWLDDRELGNDIYVTRITPTGGVLDTEGIPIPTGHFGTEGISIASDGTGFLVVWDEPRNGDHSKGDIFGTRVSAAGVVLDPLSINVSLGAGDERFPSVAWNGTNYLVAFASTGRVVATRVSSAGTVLDAGAFPLSDANGSQGLPVVTSDGTNWFIAWEDTRNGNADIFGTRVEDDRTILDGLGVPIATGTDPQQHATVAWNGTSYFVAWTRTDSSTVHIEGKRVSAAAVPVEATAIPLSSSILELDPAVAARGSTFVVTWAEFRLETSSFDIRATRVNGDGTVPDADGFAIGDSTGQETAPAIANGASSLFAVWQEGGPALLEAIGARVSSGGGVADPNGIVLSAQAPTHFEWDPAIAWNGSIFLVVWEDGRSGSLDIYGARLDAGGAVLDAAGIPIATATDGQYAPSVASNGNAFLVVWEDFRSGSTYDIYGSRVTAAGSVLGSGTPISTAANDQTHVSVGFNGTDYVVAWQDTRGGPAPDIYGSRVSTGGAVRDPAGKALSTATGDQITPSVASTSGTTLVVWNDARTGTADIRGTRVGTNGAALDPTGIAISTATRAQTSPVVAWTSGTYLVAWQDFRSGTTFDVYGARLNAAGSVLDATGIPISTAPGHQDSPAVAFNGTFLVVWRDGRSGSTYDVFAGRVGTNGSVSDANGFGAAAGPFHELAPAVAPGPGATWSVVYLRSQFTGQGTYLRTVAPK